MDSVRNFVKDEISKVLPNMNKSSNVDLDEALEEAVIVTESDVHLI